MSVTNHKFLSVFDNRVLSITGLVGFVEILVTPVEILQKSVVGLAFSIINILDSSIVQSEILQWSIGWLFLFLIGYQCFFRIDRFRTRNEETNKNNRVSKKLTFFLSALLASFLGVIFKWRLAEAYLDYGSTPDVVIAPVMIGSIVSISILALKIEESVLYLLATPVVGLAMMLAAMLYPLPELTAIGLFASKYWIFFSSVNWFINKTVLDPIEHLVLGLSTVGGSPAGTIAGVQVVLGMAVSTAAFILTPGTLVQNVVSMFSSAKSVTDVIFLLSILIGPPLYGIWFWLQISKRIPFIFGPKRHPFSSQYKNHIFYKDYIYKSMKNGSMSEELDGIRFEQLPTGYGYPIVIYFIPMSYLLVSTGWGSISNVPLIYVLLSVIAGLVSIISVIEIENSRQVMGWYKDLVSEYAEGLSQVSSTLKDRPGHTPAHAVAARSIALHIFGLVFFMNEYTANYIHGVLVGGVVDIQLRNLAGVGGGAVVLGLLTYLPITVRSQWNRHPGLAKPLFMIISGVFLWVMTPRGEIKLIPYLVIIGGFLWPFYIGYSRVKNRLYDILSQ